MKIGDAVEIAYEWWPPRHGYIEYFDNDDRVCVRINHDDEACCVAVKRDQLKPFAGELELGHSGGEHGAYFRPIVCVGFPASGSQ